jgi:hypothetical protein
VCGTILNSDIVQNPPVSTYTLDDTPPASYTAPLTNSTLVQQAFYQSGILQAGQHTLVINFTTPNSSFWLDFFLYMPSLPSSPSSPPPPPPSSQKVNIGIIVGPIIGVIVIVGAVVFWLINKRRKRNSARLDESSTSRGTEQETKPSTTTPGTQATSSILQINDSTMNDVGGDLNHYHISYYGQG